MLAETPILGSKYAEPRIKQLIDLYAAAEKDITKQLTDAALSDFERFRLNDYLKQIKQVRARC